MTEEQKKKKQKRDDLYIKENLEMITFRVKKGKKAELQELAKKEGATITEILTNSVYETYGLNLK